MSVAQWINLYGYLLFSSRSSNAIWQGSESDELAAASRLEDDVNFYQTVNPEVAKLFHIEASAKRPAFVLIKKETEKLSRFG